MTMVALNELGKLQKDRVADVVLKIVDRSAHLGKFNSLAKVVDVDRDFNQLVANRAGECCSRLNLKI